jgi:hydroxylysine kinase
MPPSLLAAGAQLDRLPPAVSVGEAAAMAAMHFGIEGVATRLSAERDSNFRIAADDSVRLLKVSNAGEATEAVAAQTEALLHIAARDPALPVPRVIPTLQGQLVLRWDGPEGVLSVRLLSYLQGTPLYRMQRSAAQRRSIGAALARLTVALRGFDHPGAHRPLLWDSTHAGDLAVLLPHIADADGRALAARFLAAFEVHAVPRLPELRTQVLHNDFNPHNLLVREDDPEQLVGIIDFGDMVKAAMVNDLAVACAYDVPVEGHPLDHAVDLVSAYHGVNPLLPEEIDVLFDLIAVRQVVSVIINTWRSERYPENRDYILRNSAAAWHGLERFDGVDRAAAQSRFRAACGMCAA